MSDYTVRIPLRLRRRLKKELRDGEDILACVSGYTYAGAYSTYCLTNQRLIGISSPAAVAVPEVDTPSFKQTRRVGWVAYDRIISIKKVETSYCKNRFFFVVFTAVLFTCAAIALYATYGSPYSFALFLLGMPFVLYWLLPCEEYVFIISGADNSVKKTPWRLIALGGAPRKRTLDGFIALAAEKAACPVAD